MIGSNPILAIIYLLTYLYMATKNTKVIEYEGTEYSIPVSFDKQYPELIQLILKT